MSPAMEWITADEVRIGDFVRLPEGEMVSSWAHWLDHHRDGAEDAGTPFRRVDRLEPSVDGRAVQVWREGHYHILPRAAHVLRRPALNSSRT